LEERHAVAGDVGVEEHEVHPEARGVLDRERLGGQPARRGRPDAVAIAAQALLEGGGDEGIVLDDQDRRGATRPPGLHRATTVTRPRSSSRSSAATASRWLLPQLSSDSTIPPSVTGPERASPRYS